jgi:hypothetical protein
VLGKESGVTDMARVTGNGDIMKKGNANCIIISTRTTDRDIGCSCVNTVEELKCGERERERERE